MHRPTRTLVVSARARTAYGAHAHVQPCGTAPLESGPHWQLVQDPVSPSVDPAYANPRNEIWLDLVTGGDGTGEAKAVLDGRIPPQRRPASVILHRDRTSTGPTDSGVAGPRLGCLSVPFPS